MTVNEQALQVNTDDLITWAIAHENAAEACEQARADHAHAVAAAQSWGPLFYEARRAAVAAVNDRETALRDQQERHEAMAQQLRKAAAQMAEMDAANRANLTISTD
ncbi:type VII secretion target [Mycobacterium sp. 050128]|uniref:type VII secretion target n=1 Tax=Mycobacterium sp. 050128 TaxID=3096112 RepID=UPI002EDBADB7